MFNEIQRGLQVAGKDGGCKVGEYISVKYGSDNDEVNKIIKAHEVELKKAVFIKNLEKVSKVETQSNIKVGEGQLLVEIIKS